MLQAYGLQFTPPSEFAPDEFMVTMRGPPVGNLKDPRMPQKQFPVRPNLIVHRRVTGAAASLGLLCSEICAELVGSIPAMKDLHAEPFGFDDQATGMMVVFDFPAGKATVRQFQAMRLDNGVLTTLTLTVDSTTLTDALKAGYYRSMATMAAPAPSTRPGYLHT